MNTTEATTAGEIALARATLYRLCAMSFRDPGEQWRRDWGEISRGVGAALEVLSADGAKTSDLCDAFDPLPGLLLDLKRLQMDYGLLFGHTPRAGVTPYETEWSGSAGNLLQYHLLSDLGAFYSAFGLELDRACDERQDHLSVELAFMHFLTLKEEHAAERGLTEHLEVCRDAQRKFVAEHLGRWIPGFCARLERTDKNGFHGRVARFLGLFLAQEERRLGVEAIERVDRLGETSMNLEDCCVSCDLASSCDVVSSGG